MEISLDNLLLRRHFDTPLDYDKLKYRLKSRLGVNYKLGIIDDEEVSLYYLNDIYTQNGLERIPSCQIRIKNKVGANGRIRITFSIAEFALIGVFSIPIIFMLILYFGDAPIPFYYALALYPLLYLIFQWYLSDQSDKFSVDLKKLEKFQ